MLNYAQNLAYYSTLSFPHFEPVILIKISIMLLLKYKWLSYTSHDCSLYTVYCNIAELSFSMLILAESLYILNHVYYSMHVALLCTQKWTRCVTSLMNIKIIKTDLHTAMCLAGIENLLIRFMIKVYHHLLYDHAH